MNLKAAMLGLALAACVTSSFAVTSTTYRARFVDLGAGKYELDGFGRGTNARIAPSAATLALTNPVPFFDIWNIDVSQMTPGDYSFTDFLIEAQGPLEFDSVVFSSIKNRVRNIIVFDISADGTQALGSGVFTVEQDCGLAVCVWLDIAGNQEKGQTAGYGGNLVATAAIPEPETYALMLAGLAALGFAARRRKAAPA